MAGGCHIACLWPQTCEGLALVFGGVCWLVEDWCQMIRQHHDTCREMTPGLQESLPS